MTDRKLLELAAKAAGYTLDSHTQCNWKVCLGGSEWNPLDDDGDALRLAVKLHMTVRCYMGTTCAQIGGPGRRNSYKEITSHNDPDAATRFAIVLAAAEVAP
jgi:hypothetical protein